MYFEGARIGVPLISKSGGQARGLSLVCSSKREFHATGEDDMRTEKRLLKKIRWYRTAEALVGTSNGALSINLLRFSESLFTVDFVN
jgi:hypothetical protein